MKSPLKKLHSIFPKLVKSCPHLTTIYYLTMLSPSVPDVWPDVSDYAVNEKIKQSKRPCLVYQGICCIILCKSLGRSCQHHFVNLTSLIKTSLSLIPSCSGCYDDWFREGLQSWPHHHNTQRDLPSGWLIHIVIGFLSDREMILRYKVGCSSKKHCQEEDQKGPGNDCSYSSS